MSKEKILNKKFWVIPVDFKEPPSDRIMIGSRIHMDILTIMQEYSDKNTKPLLDEIEMLKFQLKAVDSDYATKSDETNEAVEFAYWLLCNYNTSEEGMSLCWINADTRIATKHDTRQLYEIFKSK